MTNTELDAIEKRCNAATPGPWRAQSEELNHHGVGWCVFCRAEDQHQTPAEADAHDRVLLEMNGNFGNRLEDVAFIAHAREDMPQLIAALRSERDARKRLADIARCVVPPKSGYVVPQAAWTMLQRELQEAP